MTVFVLEDGQYSDYHIIGVFSSRENAESVQRVVGGDINEVPLDPGIAEINAGLRRHYIYMQMNGDVTVHRQDDDGLWTYCKVEVLAKNGTPVNRGIYGYVWAESAEHAAKIMNEKRTAFLATGQLP